MSQSNNDELKALLALSVIASLLVYPQIVVFSQGNPLLLPIPIWMIWLEQWDVFATLGVFGLFVMALALTIAFENTKRANWAQSWRKTSNRLWIASALSIPLGLGIFLLRIGVGVVCKFAGCPIP